MGRGLDTALSLFGKFLLGAWGVLSYLAQPVRWLWPGRRNWAVMRLADGHGRLRNLRCFCGSGLKMKRCHGATAQQRKYWKTRRDQHTAWMLERQQHAHMSDLRA